MLGKLFGLGSGGSSSAKDNYNDPGNRTNSVGGGGPAVTTLDPRAGQSGKKAARQKINQKLEDAFKGDFDDDQNAVDSNDLNSVNHHAAQRIESA